MAPMKVQARHVRKGDKIWNATPGPYHNKWVTVKSVKLVNDNWMLIDTSAWQLNISVESEIKIRRSRRERPLQVSLDGGKTWKALSQLQVKVSLKPKPGMLVFKLDRKVVESHAWMGSECVGTECVTYVNLAEQLVTRGGK